MIRAISIISQKHSKSNSRGAVSDDKKIGEHIPFRLDRGPDATT